MDFSFSEREEAFRAEVIDFLNEEVPPDCKGLYIPAWEVSAEEFFPASRAFYRKLGEKGWLALTWPEEYGGSAGTAIEQLILREEMA